MNKNSKDPRIQMFNMAKQHVEDLLLMPDEKLLQEADENGKLRDAGKRTEQAYQSAKQSVGRMRLAAAKDAVERQRRESKDTVRLIDVSRARELLQAVAANNPQFKNKYTLAARGLQDLSDEEVLSIINQLASLGAFPEGWNL